MCISRNSARGVVDGGWVDRVARKPSTASLSVPSQNKGGGFVGKVSNLPTVKRVNAQSTTSQASETGRILRKNDTARIRKKRLWKSQKLRIGSWNITSWNSRDQEIIMELNKHKIEICALSELKKRGRGNTRYQNYILFYSGKEKNQRAQAGVGILLHDKFENNIEEVHYVNSNIMYISLKTKTERTYFISVHAPDISKPKEERISFFEELQQVLDEIPKNSKVFILGDLNSRIGNTAIPGVMQIFNENVTNNNGEMLITLCAQNELRINNTFYAHKKQHKYTFGNTRDQNSVIDYIISNRTIHPSQILDVRTLTTANVGTEHGLVLCKYRCHINHQKKKPPVNIEKFNIEALNNDSTKLLYKNRLEGKMASNPITEDEDIESSWNKIKTNIIESAKEALGTRKVNINGQRNNKPWFTEEVKTLSKEKKDAYIRYKNMKTTEEYEKYKMTRNKVNDAIKEMKKAYWEKFSTDMEHDLYGGQKKIWNTLRNRKRAVNEEVQTNAITPEKWENYIKTLYGQQESNSETPEGNIGMAQILEEEDIITQEEVHEAVRKLKNRKAPGPDQITNEMLKYAGPEIEKVLTSLFQRIILNQRIPTEWKNSVTIPIYKKGNKNDPENYRMITLLNSTSKLLTKIMTTRITNSIKMSEEQQGFRPNRSTVDAIFTIRQMIEKSLEYQKPLFLCLVDLKKAFDRVQIADVLETLREHKIHENYINVVEHLNKDNVTKIKTPHGFTEKIPVLTGIRQGDSMSPILFNLIMDKIINSVKEVNGGYRMGRKHMKILCYADDAILTADNEDDLQRLLYRFQTTAKKLNMQISVEKTESMVISKEPIRCKLAVDNKPIQQTKQCTYLGVEITNHKNLQEEARTQANKASRISGYLRDLVWKNKYMSTQSKVRIYKTVVRPVLTYATETRAETTRTKSIMRAAEMKTLRTIKGVSLRDQIRSTAIREDLKIQDVVRFTRARRRYWRDHVDRMTDDQWAKWAKNEKPNSKRPPGRPPKRWRESWTSTSQEA